jgi:hypothetical protein
MTNKKKEEINIKINLSFIYKIKDFVIDKIDKFSSSNLLKEKKSFLIKLKSNKKLFL